MFFIATLASAQIKNNIPVKKDVIIKKGVDVKVDPNLVKTKSDKTDKSNLKMEKDLSGTVLSKYNLNTLYPEMKATLGGTTISTRVVPSDAVELTTKMKSNPKPKDKGSTEENGLICKNYSISLSPESENFDAPLANKMSATYPGAAYNYNQYITNNTQPAHNKSERNPIILQVSSITGNGKQVTVEDPTSNNLVEAVGQLKSSLPLQAYNISTEIYVKTIVNDASFALNVEAGGGGFGFNVNAKLGIKYESRKTYMSIDAKQKNFLITANRHDRAEGGFYKDEVENAKNENVYMSSVTYGRRVIGVIETELDEESSEIGLEASYKGFGASANLGLGILNKMSSSKTSVRLLFIGGKGDVITIPNPTEASVKAVIDNWMTNTDALGAVPVEYTFKNMRDIGMRWESVASNINYKQCVPKPPDAVAPKDWDISITLNSISNNKREKVKLGISQSVGVQTYDGWTNESSGRDIPIICWMEGWNGCQSPPEIDFTQQHPVGTTRNYTINNDQYEDNAMFRVDTKRIVMYATGTGGSKNAEENIPVYDVKLKDMEEVSFFDVPVNVNGRIFKFNYKVKILQRR